MSDIYLTRKGYDKLCQELEYLEKVKRREISKALAHARALGDLRENAEYDYAKNEQAQCERRISEIKDKLSGVRIIDDEDIPADKVFIGAKVRLRDMDTREEIEYQIVSKEEADYGEGKISIESPVGKGLMRHKVDDIVEINIPAGILKYKILQISR